MTKLMMGAEAIKCHLSDNDAAEGEIDGIDLPNGAGRLAAVRAHAPAVRGAGRRLHQPHDRGHQAGASRRPGSSRARSATSCASADRRGSRWCASGSPRCSAASPTSRSTPTRSSPRAPRSRPADLTGSIISRHRHGRARCGDDRRALATRVRQRPADHRAGRGPSCSTSTRRRWRSRPPAVSPSACSRRTRRSRSSARACSRPRATTRRASRSTAAAANRGAMPRTSRSAGSCSKRCRPRPRGDLKIEVSFRVDADGILHVRAADVRLGRSARRRRST